ncbi:hypothetical protein PWT90_08475 [Aphanocladium album]|nr:hypothetical protein PWT90_08475 [Aphanocladium album]
MLLTTLPAKLNEGKDPRFVVNAIKSEWLMNSKKLPELATPSQAADGDHLNSLPEVIERMLQHFDMRQRELEEYNKGLGKKLMQSKEQRPAKITSDSYHTGINSSGLNKPAIKAPSAPETTLELLTPTDKKSSSHASAEAVAFAGLSSNQIEAMTSFVISSPHILEDKDIDGILLIACEKIIMENDKATAMRFVHQATVLQYARSLGSSGLGRFLAAVSTVGSEAKTKFGQNVQ